MELYSVPGKISFDIFLDLNLVTFLKSQKEARNDRKLSLRIIMDLIFIEHVVQLEDPVTPITYRSKLLLIAMWDHRSRKVRKVTFLDRHRL